MWNLSNRIAACGAWMALRPDYDGLPLDAQLGATLRAWAAPTPRLIIFDNCEEPRALARRPKGGGARLLSLDGAPLAPTEVVTEASVDELIG